MNDPELPDPRQREVAELLAGLPSVSMPVEVEQRVHQALAREAAVRAGEVIDLPRRTAAPPAADTSRHGSRWLVAASAAAAVVLGSTAFITMLDQGGRDLATIARPEAESMRGEEASAADAVPEGFDELASSTDGTEELGAGSGLPDVPAELRDLVDDPGAPLGPPGCGSRLAEELNAQVVTTVVTGEVGAVLVLLQENGEQAVWWLPSCGSGPSDALGRSGVA